MCRVDITGGRDASAAAPRFTISNAPRASSSRKYGLIETLRQNVWEPLTEDLFPHLKRSAQLYYGHRTHVQWDHFLTLNTLSSKFFSVFFFCLVTKYMSQRQWSRYRSLQKKKVKIAIKAELKWKFPSSPEQQLFLCPRSGWRLVNLDAPADRPLPNSGFTALKDPFHYMTQLEVQLWTVPLSIDDWTTRSVHLSQFTDYHWIVFFLTYSFWRAFKNNQRATPPFFCLSSKRGTCPKFLKIYQK